MQVLEAMEILAGEIKKNTDDAREKLHRLNGAHARVQRSVRYLAELAQREIDDDSGRSGGRRELSECLVQYLGKYRLPDESLLQCEAIQEGSS